MQPYVQITARIVFLSVQIHVDKVERVKRLEGTEDCGNKLSLYSALHKIQKTTWACAPKYTLKYKTISEYRHIRITVCFKVASLFKNPLQLPSSHIPKIIPL